MTDPAFAIKNEVQQLVDVQIANLNGTRRISFAIRKNHHAV